MTWRYSQKRLKRLETRRGELNEAAGDLLSGRRPTIASVGEAGEILTQIERLNEEIHETRMALWRRAGKPNLPITR